jgi:LmbE family N-acetylglucosaminyl deacetylase
MTGGRRIAVIVAHPDDEVLGCGGTIRRHVLAGDTVLILILADGETSRDINSGGATIAQRESAAKAAADILGVDKIVLDRLPDNRMDTQPLLDIAKIVEKHIGEFRPDTIYTHHAGDVNVDHNCVHNAVIVATRPQPGHPVKTLLCFETPSSTEWQPPGSGTTFAPNWFVDISDVIEIKMKALHAYSAEMRPWPHPRSYEGVEYLARWRGATIGCAAAEAFVLARKIV